MTSTNHCQHHRHHHNNHHHARNNNNHFSSLETEIPIVIDSGTSTIRAGFAGDDSPRVTFPAVLGRRRTKRSFGTEKMDSKYSKSSAKSSSSGEDRRRRGGYVGADAHRRRANLVLSYPIDRGIVTDWDDMETVWRAAFGAMRVTDIAAHPLLLSQPYLQRNCNRSKLLEVAFESLRCPSLCVALSGILATYAACRQNGVVLECGDGVAAAIPFADNRPIDGRNTIRRFEITGRDLTDFVTRMLYDRKYYFDPFGDRPAVNTIKEALGEVAPSRLGSSVCDITERTLKLRDGRAVKLGAERWRCAEPLFDPVTIGRDTFGVQHTIYDAVSACPPEMHAELFANVILSGGSTMFRGFCERLRHEMLSLVPSSMPVRLVAPADRLNLTWIGGSVLGSLPQFGRHAIGIREYQECGKSIIYRHNL